MAKKNRTVYVCQNCAAQFPRWQGQCPECQSWNTVVEEVEPARKAWSPQGSTPKQVYSINHSFEDVSIARGSTDIGELDRVLGGGLFPGSFILLGGDPGIGKSTLLLQMCEGLAKNKLSVLYVTAEESVPQVSQRGKRLGVTNSKIQLISENRMEAILEMARQLKPQVLIVDSIQTVFLEELNSAPGTVSQVRECANELLNFCKSNKTSIFLIGHVTKEGGLAGPKVLEHMVDTVLSFEGESGNNFRLLRALKNRFGATHELGVFRMESEGLVEVTNPSELFLEERQQKTPGSAVFATVEGSRPLLCEIQALVSPSTMAMPRRTSTGLDTNRVHLLVAVLDKFLNTGLYRSDVFVNVVAGLRLRDPGADLAAAAALLSSSLDCPIDNSTLFVGEIGLTGEVRAVSYLEDRLREGLKLGFKKFFLPQSNRRINKELEKQGGEIRWVQSIVDLRRALTEGQPRTNKPTQPHRPKPPDSPERSL